MFGTVISIFGAIISYYIQTMDTKVSIEKQAQEILNIKLNNMLNPSIKQMEEIVIYLSNNRIIKEYAKKEDEGLLKIAEEILFSIAGTNNQIMQLRFIDKDRYEKIRVDRNIKDSDPYIIQKENL